MRFSPEKRESEIMYEVIITGGSEICKMSGLWFRSSVSEGSIALETVGVGESLQNTSDHVRSWPC